jgi:hypothetical protein
MRFEGEGCTTRLLSRQVVGDYVGDPLPGIDKIGRTRKIKASHAIFYLLRYLVYESFSDSTILPEPLFLKRANKRMRHFSGAIGRTGERLLGPICFSKRRAFWYKDLTKPVRARVHTEQKEGITREHSENLASNSSSTRGTCQ